MTGNDDSRLGTDDCKRRRPVRAISRAGCPVAAAPGCLTPRTAPAIRSAAWRRIPANTARR